MGNRSRVLAAVVAVLATAGALWFSERTFPPRQAGWEDVLAEARQGGYRIMRTEELWQRYRQAERDTSFLPRQPYPSRLVPTLHH